jgi:hypothetical protein
MSSIFYIKKQKYTDFEKQMLFLLGSYVPLIGRRCGRGWLAGESMMNWRGKQLGLSA